MKTIQFSGHALEAMRYRGATEDEVIQTIQSAQWSSAEQGRFECRKDFVFNKNWNEKFYGVKQVRPIFAEEADEIVVITVYVYYF
jgi:hypothetical protein